MQSRAYLSSANGTTEVKQIVTKDETTDETGMIMNIIPPAEPEQKVRQIVTIDEQKTIMRMTAHVGAIRIVSQLDTLATMPKIPNTTH